MLKINMIKIFKIAAGAGIAIGLAQGMGLKYSASAGVITLLSIQDTKRETIRVMTRRLCSFGLALVVSAASFSLLGYGAPAISMFLLFFSGASLLLRIQEGISVNTVLVTHFMAEQSMSIQNMGNELALLVIGAGIGVLLNLYVPGKGKEIREKQREIESRMRGILDDMAVMLSASMPAFAERLSPGVEELNEVLKQGERSAYEEMENKLLSETRYYLSYMSMRRGQSAVLGKIAEDISYLRILPVQSEQISHFIGRISSSFHEYNNAAELLEELESLKGIMRAQPLPNTREEFENRAVLYRILLELEQFLEIKKNFVNNLTAGEIRRFWKTAGNLHSV